jgi:cytochrome c553
LGHRGRALGAAVAVAVAGTALLGAAQPEPPTWLYPDIVRLNPTPGPPRSLPGSTASFTDVQLNDLFSTPDWRPGDHPPMPPIVATGRRPAVGACGFCHYPNGQGRPENAPLAGLPAAYIVEQMKAYADGTRHSARSGATNAPGTASVGRTGMNLYAKAMTEEEIRVSAEYFASIPYKPWIKVVESDTAPAVHFEAGLPVPVERRAAEPIAGRIIEVSNDPARTARRDADVGFTAYVPRGSIEKGRALANRGAPCASCHGEGLKGGPIGPPLAGRSPTYMARSLYDFRAGARNAPTSMLMKPAVDGLKDDEIVALAAYIGTLAP